MQTVTATTYGAAGAAAKKNILTRIRNEDAPLVFVNGCGKRCPNQGASGFLSWPVREELDQTQGCESLRGARRTNCLHENDWTGKLWTLPLTASSTALALVGTEKNERCQVQNESNCKRGRHKPRAKDAPCLAKITRHMRWHGPQRAGALSFYLSA